MRTYLILGRSSIAWAHALPVALWIDPAAPAYTSILILIWSTLFYFISCRINDLADLSSDSVNPARSSSPLVTGTVPTLRATYWTLVELIVLLGTVSLAPISSISQVLASAAIALTIYGNTFQKTSSTLAPLVMDALYGSTMILILIGSRTIVGSAVEPSAVLVMLSYGASVMLLNLVSGNLKDIDTDRFVGARTTAIELGVARTPDGRFAFTAKYLITVGIVQGIAAVALTASCVMTAEFNILTIFLAALAISAAIAASVILVRHLKELARSPLESSRIRRPTSSLLMLAAFLLATGLHVEWQVFLIPTAGALAIYVGQKLIRRDEDLLQTG
ncbi:MULTISPECIES: UbiA family prenyltransferase [Rhodococcus]|uniref:UbiA family prenyltransferase n=1 Tax=Rhodococcus TaxID=1827 RepID=UPI0026B5BCCD